MTESGNSLCGSGSSSTWGTTSRTLRSKEHGPGGEAIEKCRSWKALELGHRGACLAGVVSKRYAALVEGMWKGLGES